MADDSVIAASSNNQNEYVSTNQAIPYGYRQQSTAVKKLFSDSANPTQANEISFINALNSDNTIVTDPNKSYWTYAGTTARKWGSSVVGTTGGTVTYYFDPSSKFSTTEMNTIKEGLALWSAETNINFAQATSQASANVLMHRGSTNSGEYFDDEGHVIAGSGSTDGTYNGQTTINFDTNTYGFDLSGSFVTAGGYGIGSAVHEMGHLLGLGHGGPYNGSVQPSSDQYSAYDSRLWSIMSYIEPYDATAKYYSSYPVKGTYWGNNSNNTSDIETSTTPMPLDILAAQQIYGTPVGGPLSGGNVFGFNSNIDPSIKNFFDFTVNTKPVVTLFDTGTNNTLDLSGFNTSSTVDLTPGSFSSTSGQTNNIGIAYGTIIDHVVGGSAADNITGTSRAETLTGGGGADTLKGGGGADLYKDNATDLNGDTITDFITLDTIDVTNAIAAVTDLMFSGTTLSFLVNGITNVSMTLDGISGTVEQSDDTANGGVDIYFAPPKPTAPVLADDTGSSQSDELTRDPTITYPVPLPSDTLIYSTDGLTYSSNAPIFKTDGTNDGSHTVYIEQEDSAGHRSPASSLTFTLDDTNPVVLISTPGGSVASSSQTISGTATDAHVGSTVSLYDNGSTTPFATAQVMAGGTWSTMVTLSQGTNSIVAKNIDLAGNTGASAAVVYTYGTPTGLGGGGGGGGSTTSTPASNPTIAGTHAIADAGEQSVAPFGASAAGGPVTIGDTNVGATDSLTITLAGGGGTLSGAGLTGSGNSYSLAATDPTTLSNELDALTFTPTNGTPGATVNTTFTLAVSSSAGTSATDGNTVVADTAASAPTPIVTGPEPGPNPPLPMPTPTSAPDAVSISSVVSYSQGTFTITGKASSISSVGKVEITAQVDGVATDLGTATVDANGNFNFSELIGANTQSFITAVETDAAGGTASAQASYSLTGGLSGGKGRQDRYTADGSAEAATDVFKADGSQKATLFQSGQAFASSFFDTFSNSGAPNTTFVFNPGFGRDVVDLFRVDGADHDTVSFKGSDYGNDITTVLASARDTAAGLLITDPTASSPGGGPGTHDTLLLKGVTKQQLAQNQGDIAFHA